MYFLAYHSASNSPAANDTDVLAGGNIIYGGWCFGWPRTEGGHWGSSSRATCVGCLDGLTMGGGHWGCTNSDSGASCCIFRQHQP